MSEEEKDAKASESSSDNKGAKGDSPTPEDLKAAQDAAEKFRKEAESAREELESKKEEYAELEEKHRLTEAEEKRKRDLALGIEDDEHLVSQLERQARDGDRNARAYLAAMDKRSERVAREVIKKELTQSQLERDFDARDSYVEEMAKTRNMTVAEFKDLIDPYAAPYPKEIYTPLKQAKLAYAALEREEKLVAREKKIEEYEKKNSSFRDSGTGQEAEKKKPDFTKDWRAAKTPVEKESALSDI